MIAPPCDDLPTGGELVERYLAPLAALPQIAPHIRYGSRVDAVARDGVDRVRTRGREQRPFVIRLDSGEELLARTRDLKRRHSHQMTRIFSQLRKRLEAIEGAAMEPVVGSRV